MFEELNEPISNESILKAIKQLNTNKIAGPDMIFNEFFIHGKDVLLPFLYTLFNKIFTIGYFPQPGRRVLLFLYIRKEV